MSLKISLKKKKKPDLDVNPQDVGNDDELPKECSESDATEGKPEEAEDEVIDEVKEEVEDEVKEKGKVKEKVKSKDKVKEKVKKVEGKSEVRSKSVFGSLFGKKVTAAAEEVVGDLDKTIATIGEDLPGIDEMSKDPTNVDSWIDGVSPVVDGSMDQQETESVTESEEEEAEITSPEPKNSVKMSLNKGTKKTDLDSESQYLEKNDELPSKECLESDNTEEKSDEAAGKVTDEIEDKVKEKGKVKSKDKDKVKEKVKDVKKAEGKSVVRSKGAFGNLFGKKVAATAEGAVGDVNKAVATIGEDLSGIGEMSKDPTNVDSLIDGVSSVINDGLAEVVSDGLAGVSDGLTGINDGLAEVNEGLTGVSDGLAVASDGLTGVSDQVAEVVSDGLTEIYEGLEGVSDGLAQISDGVAAVVSLGLAGEKSKVTSPEPKKVMKMSLKMILKKSKKKPDLDSDSQEASKEDELTSKECLESETIEEKPEEAAVKVTDEAEDEVEDEVTEVIEGKVKEKGKVKSKDKVKNNVKDTKVVKKPEGKSQVRSKGAGAFGSLFGKKVAAAAEEAVTVGEDHVSDGMADGNQTETDSSTESEEAAKVTLQEPKMILKKSKKKPDLDSNSQDAGKEDELTSKECLESDTTEEKPEEAEDEVIDEVKDQVEDEVKEKGKVKEKAKSKDKDKVKEKVKKAEGKSEVRSKGAGTFGSLFGKKVAAAAEEVVGDPDKTVSTIGEDLLGIGEIIKDPTNVNSWIDGVSPVVDGSMDQKETKSLTESEEDAKVTSPEPKKSKKKSLKMSLKKSKKKPDLDSESQDAGKDDKLPSKECLESDTTEEKPDEAADEAADEEGDEEGDEEVKGTGKSDARIKAVVYGKTVGGIFGGALGAAAAGAIVGAVCDVGTAIATGGKEMNGICGIIRDPTNKEAWKEGMGISSFMDDLNEKVEAEKQKRPGEESKETAPKLRVTMNRKSMHKSVDVDADPADQDLVRIYDISTQKMRKVLKEAGIALPDYKRGRSASGLVKELQRLIETTQNGSFTLPSYFKLYDSLHELVTVHKAEFQMSRPSTITLAVASESVCFDDNLKRFIAKLLLPVHAAHKVPLEEVANDKKFHCIYRFRCIICARQGNEFVYVGQSKNFKPRFETHTGQMLRDWVKSEERSTLQIGNPLAKSTPRKSSSTVFDHPVEFHPDLVESEDDVKFRDILEVDIVHRFSEISKDKTEKTIRSNWETFSQWLFKSIEKETESETDSETEKETENESENPSENGTENGTENAPENSTENEPENSTENAPENLTENTTENGTENGTKNGTKNGTENAPENLTENVTENATDDGPEC